MEYNRSNTYFSKNITVINLSGLKELASPNSVFYLTLSTEQDRKYDNWAHELYKKNTGKRNIEIANGGKHSSYILRENKPLRISIINWFNNTL